MLTMGQGSFSGYVPDSGGTLNFNCPKIEGDNQSKAAFIIKQPV